MKIGPYEFLRELGLGGMARVSLCLSDEGQLLVVKQPLVDSPEVFKQLVDEANAGKRIEHPNVVKTFKLFYHNDLPCIALEYIPGATLHQLRKARGAMPKTVVMRVGRQICEALDAIHNAKDDQGQPLNMLHRDISPSNIILGHDGNARLIDLGIAKSEESESPKTKTGLLRGKVHYFAPELFHEGQYSPSSDLWALSVVLYESLLGRRALKGSQAKVMRKICSGDILDREDAHEIDSDLLELFKVILDVDPGNRVSNARNLANSFKTFEIKFKSTQGMAARIAQRWVLAEIPTGIETVRPPMTEENVREIDAKVSEPSENKSVAEIFDFETASGESESKSVSLSDIHILDARHLENEESQEKVVAKSAQDISLKIARYVQNLDALSFNDKIK